MNYIIDTTKTTTSKFIPEDYFPAIVEFNDEELNNHFIEYSYKDSDMFEFSVHPKTHALKRLTLTLCNHFEIIDNALEIPTYDDGAIFIDGESTVECKTFIVSIYNDGAVIKISDITATKYIKTGNLIFAFSNGEELVQVYLVNLSSSDIMHIKDELIQ